MVLDNITAGKWGDQSTRINNNFNKTNAEIIALQGIANGGGKLFATVELLTAAYPNLTNSNVGIYAYVSANLTFPAKIYRWNGTAWSDTGQTGNGGDAAENIDATLSTKIVQEIGTNQDKMMSQNAVTSALKNRANTCFVAISPQWNIDEDYNITIDIGMIDLYIGFSFVRLNPISPISFMLHYGSDLIVYDSSTNSIIKSDALTETQYVIGCYFGTDLYINGNVTVYNTSNKEYQYNKMISSDILSYLRKEQNFCLNAVSRAPISVSNNIVTIGIGCIYFNDKQGNEIGVSINSITNYTVQSDGVLVFSYQDHNFYSKPKTSVTEDDQILLFYDNVSGFVLNGLWGPIILKNSIDSLNTRVSTIEANGNLPSFITTAAKATFKRIQKWIGTDTAFMLAQITDVHSGGNTKYLHVGYLNELNKMFGFDILCNSGDIGLDVGETEDVAYELMYNTKKGMNCSSPFVFCKGNHDYGTASVPISILNNIFNIPIKKNFSSKINLKTGNDSAGYGYVDNDIFKIRTFFLNTSDFNAGGYSIGNTQLQFIVDNLLNIPYLYNVIILTHLCVDPIGRWVSYPTDADGSGFDTLRSIISAFVSKTSGSNSTTNISWNFTNISTNSKLICSLSGDSHFNNYIKRNGVNYIVRQGYGGISDGDIPAGGTKDIFDYNNQCLFDILVVKNSGVAKIFRIGAGDSNRDLQFTF